ncbi:hypothetical protein HW560_30495 [Paenibacillus sp. E222]|uniref:hypothetical protein n=1 Tax=Paenibacillus sp. E222 TaxID=2748863 RepID=UPI0015C5A22A|nr:hypothetical protein [Paenibacillus sp. E222]QLG42023.1 hypothetical protein HW560_30495 [Paenibacillus sp. E222]
MEDIFIQSASELKKMFTTNDNGFNPLLITLLSGGFGSIITLVITYFMTLNRDKNQYKQSNRTYIVAEEIDSLGSRLEGYNNVHDKDLRIIETDNFIELDQLVRDGVVQGELLNYLRLRNLGPAMVIQCSIALEIESNQTIKEIKKVVPIFLSDQELFIFAQSLENHPHPQLLKRATVVYKTIANEEIKYVYDVRREQGKTICREQYYVKSHFGYKLLNISEVDKVSWIFINHYRN